MTESITETITTESNGNLLHVIPPNVTDALTR